MTWEVFGFKGPRIGKVNAMKLGEVEATSQEEADKKAKETFAGQAENLVAFPSWAMKAERRRQKGAA